jgi:predicted FMN-binding regulatory protein PaiB
MAFTDGLQRAALKKSAEGYSPFNGFCEPIFSFASEVSDIGEAEVEIAQLLSSKKLSDNSEDDKTLVIAVLGNESRSDSGWAEVVV